MITALSRRLRRLADDRRGLTALEFGLIAVPLVLLLLAVVQIGAAVRIKSALQYATARAARCAAVDSTNCGTTAKVQAYALANAGGIVQLSTSSFTVSTAACGKSVSASVPLPIISHLVVAEAVTLTAKACYPV